MPYSPLAVAAAVEYSIASAALFVMIVFLYCRIRFPQDAFRRAFTWLKCGIVLFCIFDTLEAVIYIRSSFSEPGENWPGGPYLGPATWVLATISDEFLFLHLIELYLCFVAEYGIRRPVRTLRYGSYFLASSLVAMDLANLAIAEDATYKILHTGDPHPDTWTPTYVLYGSINIIYWFFSMGVLVLVVDLLYHSHRLRKPRDPSHLLFLAAAVVNLVRACWQFAFAITWQLMPAATESYPAYVEVLDPIMYSYMTTALVGILLAIGSKRQRLSSSTGQDLANRTWPARGSEMDTKPSQKSRFSISKGRADKGGGWLELADHPGDSQTRREP